MLRGRITVTERLTGGKELCGPTMSLALMVWLCSIPFVFLLLAPFFGWKVAGVTALGLLVALIVACFGICTTKVYQGGGKAP
jgi:hypothetical protein